MGKALHKFGNSWSLWAGLVAIHVFFVVIVINDCLGNGLDVYLWTTFFLDGYEHMHWLTFQIRACKIKHLCALILGSLYLQRPPQRSCNPYIDPLYLLPSEIRVQVVAPHRSSESPACVLQSASSRLYTFLHLSFTSVTDLWAVPTAFTFSVIVFQIDCFFWFVKVLLNFDSKIGFCLTSLCMILTSITLKFWLLDFRRLCPCLQRK